MTATTLPQPVAAALRRFAATLTLAQLVALRDGLAADSPELVSHHVALAGPVSMRHGGGWDYVCEGGCLIGYALRAGGLRGAQQVRGGYFEVVRSIDVGAMVGWFDATPRAESFPLLAAECDAILAEVAA